MANPIMFVFLDIVSEFLCEQCGTCCRNNWLVTVDEAAYRRNRDLFGNLGRTEEFEQAFLPLPAEAGCGEYACIAKKPAGGCWFLTDQKLCSLQQLAGHAHLDAVCQWYPRYPMDTERGIELSLSFSCPAAVRLALQKQVRIVRDAACPVEQLPQEFVTHVYPGQQPANTPLRYYFEIEGHLIDILQTGSVSLNDRLALVRETIECLRRLNDSSTLEREMRRLIQTNYDRIDAQAALAENSAAVCLMENFFVNFIFRKNLYCLGFDRALERWDRMRQRLAPFLDAPLRREDELAALVRIIMQLELEYNHNSGNQAT